MVSELSVFMLKALLIIGIVGLKVLDVANYLLVQCSFDIKLVFFNVDKIDG